MGSIQSVSLSNPYHSFFCSPLFALFLLFFSALLPFFPRTAVDTRAVAGIVLKNNIKKMYAQLSAQAPQILEDVKTQCMLHIGDPSQLIRATVGLIITMIVQQGELANWPTLLPSLLTVSLRRTPMRNTLGAIRTPHLFVDP